MTRPRILCVDDEPNVLDGLQRTLRKKFDVTTSPGGEAALARLAAGESFEVVVSDMRMPSMNGTTLLSRFRETAPDTVRLLLTGYAEIEAAIAAVNQARVFRFLTKPCPPEVLIPAIEEAAEQHRLVTAERVLLEQTLVGSVRALTEALALSRPEAFMGQARQHERARKLAERLRVPDAWHVEVASMLGSIGFVVLPADIVAKMHAGSSLDASEREMVKRLPEVADRVLAHIPRLDNVKEVLKHQLFDVPKEAFTANPPIGSLVLAALRELAAAEARLGDYTLAVAHMRTRANRFGATLLDAMEAVCEPPAPATRPMRVVELRAGMVFASDVKAQTGLLLVARGQRATEPLLERLRNFAFRVGIVEPVHCEPEG
ncbi:MAG TPA: response regulator [Polyangiaceae bacterium]|jgi:response regulator RpfG family c-di-GMP phosphodiesterase|nr:response regulator [Polyangiaceae bacterium]